MNAATRAVIERLVEALEQYAPRDRAVMQDLIAEARKLLEGDAILKPASEDAWLVEAEQLVRGAIKYAEKDGNSNYLTQLRAHLRARPAREGFVSVPVEPVVMTSAALDDLLYPAMCGWDNSDIPLEQYSERIWEILRHHGFSICAFGDVTEQAMIAAAKGDRK